MRIPGQTEAPATFSVLAVCTANRYRSPMIEFFLQAAVNRAGLRWRVTSAGTHAADGLPVDPLTKDLLAGHGIDTETSEWRSRLLTDEILAGADLVLTADRRQRSTVSVLRPAVRERTFLLLRFADLAAFAVHEATRAGRPSSLHAAVRLAQSQVQPARADEDQLADPVGHSVRTFRACAAAIRRAADTVAEAAVRIQPS